MRFVRPVSLDLTLQSLDEGQIVDGGKPDHHGAKIRIARQEPAHRLDEQVAAFLLSHPAERSDRIFSRQTRLGEGRAPVGGGRHRDRRRCRDG